MNSKNKIYKNFTDFAKDWIRVTCWSVNHSNHYIRMDPNSCMDVPMYNHHNASFPFYLSFSNNVPRKPVLVLFTFKAHFHRESFWWLYFETNMFDSHSVVEVTHNAPFLRSTVDVVQKSCHKTDTSNMSGVLCSGNNLIFL